MPGELQSKKKVVLIITARNLKTSSLEVRVMWQFQFYCLTQFRVHNCCFPGFSAPLSQSDFLWLSCFSTISYEKIIQLLMNTCGWKNVATFTVHPAPQKNNKNSPHNKYLLEFLFSCAPVKRRCTEKPKIVLVIQYRKRTLALTHHILRRFCCFVIVWTESTQKL